jgi:hypothetical protein
MYAAIRRDLLPVDRRADLRLPTGVRRPCEDAEEKKAGERNTFLA